MHKEVVVHLHNGVYLVVKAKENKTKTILNIADKQKEVEKNILSED